MIKNWAPWLAVLLVNILYYLNLAAGRRRFESLLVSDWAFADSGTFTGRSDVHIPDQVW